MTWDALFRLVGNFALAGWLALIILPRRAWLTRLLRFGVVGVLAALYASLMFASDPVLIAGWVHYLAFDLFIGVWIAERLDAERVSRWLQAPILIATFMFGPVGLLLGFAPGAFSQKSTA